jgi:hypothetical protein
VKYSFAIVLLAGSVLSGNAWAVAAESGAPSSSSTSYAPTVPPTELAKRGEAALGAFYDGIVLLHGHELINPPLQYEPQALEAMKTRATAK